MSMRRKFWRVLVLLAPVVLVAGCEKKATTTPVPTNLDQPLPEGVSTGGGPAKGGAGKKAPQGGKVSD
jgi:hypothetical protein